MEYVFGPYVLDDGERTLTHGGAPVALTPKVFDLLLLLVRRAGATLTREELLAQLWPDAVVAEANLTQNVWMLRKALDDQGDAPRYVATVPRRGYRFVAPVVARDVPRVEAPALVQVGDSVPLPVLRPPRRRRNRRLVGALVLVALAALAAWPLLRAVPAPRATPESRPASPVRMRRAVAILGFRSHTGAEATAWMSTALTEMLRTELAVGERLRTIPGETVDLARADLALHGADALSAETLARVRARLGADVVVLGSYLATADGVRVDLRVQDTQQGDTLAAWAENAREAELGSLAARAGARLRTVLGAGTMSAEQGRELAAAWPRDADVARLYAQGLARLRHYDAAAAQALFAEALRLDPDDALVQAALAEALAVLGRDAEARAAAARAVELSRELSRESALWIQARQAELARDWPRAVHVYGTLWEFFPDNPEYGLAYASALTAASRAREALVVTEALRRLPSPVGEDARIDFEESQAADALSDYKRQAAAGERMLRHATAQGAQRLVARAHLARAWAAHQQGDHRGGEVAARESQRIFQQVGDRRGVALALVHVGLMVWTQGDLTQGAAAFAEAHSVFSAIGDARGTAVSLNNLAIIHLERGDLPAARRTFQETLELKKRLGDRAGIARSLNNLSVVDRRQGDLPRARAQAEEALALRRAIEDRAGIGETLVNVATAHEAAGDLPRARAHAEEGLKLTREVGDRSTEAYVMDVLARLALDAGDVDAARTQAEAARRLRDELGEKSAVAISQLLLAQVEMEGGRLAEAETQARAALARFAEEKQKEDVATARVVLARVLAAAGRGAEAVAAAEAARTEAAGIASALLAVDGALALAAAQLAAGAPPAIPELARVAAEADRIGFARQRWDAHLLLARAEEAAGRGEAARGRRARVAAEARGRGFVLVAARAAR